MTDSDKARLKTVFEERFATDLGRISVVLQSIPLIDTGNDGAEFVLSYCYPTENKSIVCSANPSLNNGHDGTFDVSLAERCDNRQLKPWYRFDVRFDADGLLFLFEAV